MDKLQYDSLYKFLVSLGLIMILLPVAVLAYLLNSELILISQDDFEALSKLSQQMITNRDKLLVLLRYIFPWFAGLFMLLGVGLLIYGLLKWKEVQKNLDKKLDAETTLQMLSVLKMTPNKDNAKSGKNAISPQPQSDDLSTPVEPYLINKKCFNYVISTYGRDYRFEKELQIGNYRYDFIGVSQNSAVDLLVEIKSWKNISALKHGLPEFFHRILESGTAYKTITHRNFRWIIFVATSKDQLQEAKTLIAKHLNDLPFEYNSKINVQYISKDDI